METRPTRILLVEDNLGDARLIREMLAETGYGSFEIEWVSQLSEGLERLVQGGIDLVLLDLGLPDSQGLETFIRAYDYGSDLPFVVLTGLEDETVGLAALRRGAEDYLVKGKVDGELLARTIRYSIERRRSQNALRAERGRLFNLLEALPAVVYVKAPDYAIRFANRRFEELFGSWEGKRCYEAFYGGMAPCAVCQSFEVLQTRETRMWEWTRPQNGRIYQIYSYPFADIDDAPLILSLGIDITDCKQAEKSLQRQREELQMILDSVPAMIFYKDRNDRFIRVNKAMAEITGLPAAEIEGKTASELYTEPAYWQDDLEVITSGNPKRNIVEPLQTATGKRWAQTDKIPYRDERGEIIGVIGFAQDITERQQMEETQKDAEERLRFLTTQLLTAQEDERKRLCQGLHDELGHALLALKLDLRAMSRQLPPEQLGLAENVTELAYSVDQVIENVRRLYLNLTPGDLEDLGLTAALQNLGAEFARHQEKISWSVQLDNIDRLFPIRVQTAIYRIFQEILTNIGKHADPTAVSVAAQRRDGLVRFEVKDNGKGFDRDIGWQSSAKAGMGLLALEERIRMLGGSLHIWSRKNRGTMISFTIPVEA